MFWKTLKRNAKGAIKIGAMKDQEGNWVFKEREMGMVIRDSFKKRLAGSDVPVSVILDRMEEEGDYNQEVGREVTMEEMKMVLRDMKNGRAPDGGGIKVELLKKAHGKIHGMILDWINVILEGGKIPYDMKGSVIKLIHKRGDNACPENFRPIAISPILIKLVTKILNVRVVEVLERENLLADVQFGFRPGRSTLDAIFLTSAAIEKARIQKIPLYIGFLDLEAAYDRLDRKVMIEELIKLGFGGVVTRFLADLYSGDYMQFDVNGVLSAILYLVYGVRQGDSFSSTCFNVSYKKVAVKVDEQKKGIEIGGRCLSGLAFADDGNTLTRSAADHNRMLELVESTCKTINMKLSKGKSKLMKTDGTVAGDEIPELAQVAAFKYLGVSLEHKTHQYYTAYSMSVASKADTYGGAVKAMANSSPDPVLFATEMWKKIALPAIFYGCEVLPIRKAELAHVDAVAAGVGKYILQLNKSAANVVAALGANIQPARYYYLKKVMAYHAKIKSGEANEWVQAVWKEQEKMARKSGYFKLIDWIEENVMNRNDWDIHKICLDEYMSECINDERAKHPSMRLMPVLAEGEVGATLHMLNRTSKSKAYVQFMTFDAQLGNRTPLKRRGQDKRCELCFEVRRIKLLTEIHLLFECKELQEVREEEGFVQFSETHGGELEDQYGSYWRMRDIDDEERRRRVSKAIRVRDEFWRRMGVEDTADL